MSRATLDKEADSPFDSPFGSLFGSGFGSGFGSAFGKGLTRAAGGLGSYGEVRPTGCPWLQCMVP